VRLTEERWMHIVSRHPEMAEYRSKVLETIATPDYVQQGDFGELPRRLSTARFALE